MGANGVAPDRAARRRAERNTPTLSGLGAAGDELAQVIGVAVAQALAPHAQAILAAAQAVAQMLPRLAPQKEACLYCAARAKMAEHAHAQALAALQAEYEIACKAAAELGDSPPEFTPPAAPELPPIQEMFTRVPVVVAQGMPAVSVPVCFDDLPSEPAAPGPRPTGLVTGDGRPVIAQAG